MRLHLQRAGSTSVATTGLLHAGLGDARAAQLLSALRQAAEEAAGEMALVQLAAAAQDAVDAANSPEGDCPICMFPLVGGGSGEPGGSISSEAQKLPCFHCMHRWSCRCSDPDLRLLEETILAYSGCQHAGCMAAAYHQALFVCFLQQLAIAWNSSAVYMTHRSCAAVQLMHLRTADMHVL
jgi:hypothetical protein